MAVCCESSGRFSDSEHSAVFSVTLTVHGGSVRLARRVGMCRMVDIRGHSAKHHTFFVCSCRLTQGQSLLFKVCMCVYQSHMMCLLI